MSDAPRRLSNRAAELRLAFDRSFAAPPQADAAPQEDLLGIRLSGQCYAIRLSEITGLFADKAITRVPSEVPTLLGIAGFRGAILPVYGLDALLGHAVADAPRWLVVASGASIAFAFEGFDGHLRISRENILERDCQEAGSKFVRDFARSGGIARPIVHLPSILDVIVKRPQDAAAMKEQ